MQRFAEWLVARRLLLLLACGAAAAAAWPLAQRIVSDRSVHTLFAPHDPRLLRYDRTTEEFGGEATCIAAYTDPDALTPEGMVRLKAFRDRLAATPCVRSALSLAELPHPRDPTLWRDFAAAGIAGTRSALTEGLNGLADSLRQWRPRPLAEWFATLPTADRAALAADVRATELYRDVFIGADGATVAVVLQLDRDAMASGAAAAAIEELRAACAAAPFPGALVGAPVMVNDVFEYLSADTRTLRWVSTGIMLATILALFRNVRWVLAPAAVVAAATLLTQALQAAVGIRLSLIGAMTDSLVTVIGIAMVTQVAVLYGSEARRAGGTEESADSSAAMVRTLARILGPFAWACVITAVGFAALAVSQLRPVREYAFVMATASLFVGLATLLVAPGGALLGRRWLRAAPRPAFGEAGLARQLGRIAHGSSRHAWKVLGATLAITAVAALGIGRLKVETDFTKNFREDAPLLQGYRFVEDRLGGAGVLEIVCDAPAVTPETLRQLRAATAELAALPGVTKANSLADIVGYAERLLGSQRLLGRGKPGRTEPPAVPAEPSAVAEWLTETVVENGMLAALQRMPDGSARRLVRNFWNPEARRLRLVLRVQERQGTDGKRQLIERAEAIVARRFGPSAGSSGMMALTVYLVDTLLADQWVAVEAAALGVVVAAALAFRSLPLGLVAFAPKIALVTAVIGAMGWAGLKVNAATAMIGSVSMGLVVAFSVPYLARFVAERKAGADFDSALANAHGSAGKAMVFANLALMLGFLALGFSRFVPTVHFGLLVAVAILGGVVGNLVLLPALLRVVDRRP